jgi:hypothetical protein
MIQWLYRYVFRGIGVLLVIGMITILILAINRQTSGDRHSANRPAAPSYSDHR